MEGSNSHLRFIRGVESARDEIIVVIIRFHRGNFIASGGKSLGKSKLKHTSFPKSDKKVVTV